VVGEGRRLLVSTRLGDHAINIHSRLCLSLSLSHLVSPSLLTPSWSILAFSSPLSYPGSSLLP
jgi:hypothetical protein